MFIFLIMLKGPLIFHTLGSRTYQMFAPLDGYWLMIFLLQVNY